MPYCSIEEAWGSKFTNNNKSPLMNIVPDNAHNEETYYSDVDFENHNLRRNKSKKSRHNYKRNMNRLPQTNGPNNRYVNSKNNKSLKFTQSNKKKPRKKLKRQKKVSFKNIDTPINAYNKSNTQKLYNSTDLSNSDHYFKIDNKIKSENNRDSGMDSDIDSDINSGSDSDSDSGTDNKQDNRQYTGNYVNY